MTIQQPRLQLALDLDAVVSGGSHHQGLDLVLDLDLRELHRLRVLTPTIETGLATGLTFALDLDLVLDLALPCVLCLAALYAYVCPP